MDELSWFWKILIEGIAVALFVVLAVFLPWLPLQLFFLVLLGYILWLLFRNPRFFYRRLAHAVLWVLLLPPLGQLSLRFFGYSAGETGGVVRLALELGPGPSSALLLGLVVLFVGADLLSGWIDDWRTRRRIGIKIEEAVVFAELDGRYDCRIDLFVTAPVTAAAAIGAGAQFRASMCSRWTDADIYQSAPGGEEIPLADNETIGLAPGSIVKLLIKGEAEAGLAGKWLLWWSRQPRRLQMSYGAVMLAAVPESGSRTAPITFQLRAPGAPPVAPSAARKAGGPG